MVISTHELQEVIVVDITWVQELIGLFVIDYDTRYSFPY